MRIGLFIFLLPLLFPSFIQAQEVAAPCGVVDALDYPIDNLVKGYDDFALYRPRFEGNHTGLDIGFDRWGDPVQAAARGRVTYSDVEGWDTEKGVVIIEHTFPDGSLAYSLYGHMEQTDAIFFPAVGSCVERGQVIGAIGWPSLGRPHLHYEIRDFLPDDGGPGYVTGNPLAEGWYNPLDFTALWRARLTPAFIDYVTFDSVASVPPVQLDSGIYVIASSSALEGVLPPNQLLWRIETDGVVTGLAALPGNRVVAHTHNGQVVVLENGRYAAVWTVSGPDEPFLVLGDRLVFALQDGGLEAYDTAGGAIWSAPGTTGARIVNLQHNGQQIALGLRTTDGTVWRLIDAVDGQVRLEKPVENPFAVTPTTGGSWMLASGSQLERVNSDAAVQLTEITPPVGRTLAITVDLVGNSYLYLADSDSTLLSYDPDGNLRWRVTYPAAATFLPPLLRAGSGCLLYTLDSDGMLNVFAAADGALLNQLPLYAGGTERTSPSARLLEVDSAEKLRVASGFLTMMTLDGLKLGGVDNCLLG